MLENQILVRAAKESTFPLDVGQSERDCTSLEFDASTIDRENKSVINDVMHRKDRVNAYADVFADHAIHAVAVSWYFADSGGGL